MCITQNEAPLINITKYVSAHCSFVNNGRKILNIEYLDFIMDI